MASEVNIRIAGEAGQGTKTIGDILNRTLVLAGLNIFTNLDYMSRVRGGDNFVQIRASETEVFSPREEINILVSLNPESASIHKRFLSPDGIFLPLEPLSKIAQETGGDIYINSAAAGAVAAALGINFEHLEKVLAGIFANKDKEIIGKNIKAARSGYELDRTIKFKLNASPGEKKILLEGSEAIALGAIKAGVRFYSAYPMTPSTGILNNLAHYARQFNILVEQAEDEIAAINMAIGASFAGVRAMTGTSGGGFALMNEGLSLAAMTETPVVIVEAQRPAPATGFPTRTEQGDLDYVIHAGHGEFARVVFAPGSVSEAYYLTQKAFNLADKYQIPVIILSDQHLAESVRSQIPFDLNRVKIERHLLSEEVPDYKRYRLTGSGISPRAIPGAIKTAIYADSDEHDEAGHITEEAATRIEMVKKRFYKKMAGLKEEVLDPVPYKLPGAKILLLGFGSTHETLHEVCDYAADLKAGHIHFPQVWPFPAEKFKKMLFEGVKLITVENNASAQLAGLIRRECGITVFSSILRFDGRPFSLDFVLRELKEKVKHA
ncbi:hypothetical protein A2276_02020 [candidate division WOR-1 bacterium RIFOXYA12_FULL_43_27]|uniref:2-oxoacid:ferredoxin oxidoreductase subunit alpha n=1 Tax=candidate division WOR-1 bacterium RIFOXYC2_FULL_46_14 TaxID=1802587 RepID=A0A1F4U6Q6_UNCSA|nr:MAG: hypothetical protein A2276_02020 [candidate division WOR-1 bacterium RIFOXYA12_FULL_43_27]OGC19501.1 MAG: hypothetical protein A2292_02310 [candidate division WOR-1 bacterium RIFOXYB2_FULL_46_45]OGC30489.1 MAG: hypothetical protein A2232_02310 [candidate division WOR-1 bacterium RIFOXYA2_FULL_46_56]OGC40557.1 MAG: hypothetical protein A2438_06025 [candidate division WOR-1 bacterium RIFOXYC2_FULL_46_14]